MWLYDKDSIQNYPIFACGSCIGRGEYIYPGAYDKCDCGGYQSKAFNLFIAN
jgi:hypothetical protein